MKDEETKSKASSAVTTTSSKDGSDPPSSRQPEPPMPPKHKKPRKQTQFGQADPIRDVSIFAAILGFLFFMSWVFSDVGNPEADGLLNKANILGTTMKTIGQLEQSLQVQLQRERRTKIEDCKIFMSQTSLPMEAFGLFAGKNFTAGEPIFATTTTAESSFISLSSSWMEETVYLPWYALLINHHPIFSNLRPDPVKNLFVDANSMLEGPPMLVARRDIVEGEELLLPWEFHPARFLDNFGSKIPQYDHYRQAQKIMEETRFTLQAADGNIPVSRKADLGMALRAVSGAVAHYDKIVAGILPTNALELVKYSLEENRNKKLLELSVSNQTKKSLSLNGYCLDDTVKVKEGSLHTTRAIEVNQTFYTMPLFVHLSPYQKPCENLDQTCSSKPQIDVCYGQSGSSVSLCPLLPGSLRVVDSLSEESKDQVNAKLEWDSRSTSNRKRAMYSPKELLSEVSFQLSHVPCSIISFS
jgi:hypothetical protein